MMAYGMSSSGSKMSGMKKKKKSLLTSKQKTLPRSLQKRILASKKK